MNPKPRRRHLFNALVCAAVLFSSTACVSRELTIRSDPPGAVVYRDREELGKTPLTVSFTYGGESEFLLLHEQGEELRYRPTRVRHDTGRFFYDTFPFDLFVELLPVPVNDRHEIEVVLEPDTTVDTVEGDPEGYVKALLERATEMRERGRQAATMGAPRVAPLLPPSDADEDAPTPRER